MVASVAPVDAEPVVASAEEALLLEALRDALAAQPDRSGATRLVVEGASPTVLPKSVHEVLVRVVRELVNGNAVTVLPTHVEMTTQEAADLLNVSRPYLIGLVDQGIIACTRTTGGHRRLRLSDVLAYKHTRDSQRRTALDEMSAEAERLDLDY